MVALQLVQNAAVVFLLASVQQWILSRWSGTQQLRLVLSGVLYGASAVIVMANPIVLADGYIFDGRSVILSIAGLFGGPVVAAIAAAIAVGHRLAVSGIGVVPGVIVIITSAAIGTLFWELGRRGLDVMRPLPLYLMGFVVHALAVWVQVFALGETGLGAMRVVGPSLIVFLPVATMVVALLLAGQEERQQMRLSLAEQAAQLVKALDSVIRVVDAVVEIRDPYTAGHQRRTAKLAKHIAMQLELPEAQVRTIEVAGQLHDVGKIAVPAEVLSRPGELSKTERQLVETHAEAGYRLLATSAMESSIAELVWQHHERCDGTGYPRGLASDQLLLGAKVLMVADVVEAMSSHRPYRAAHGLDEALDEIRRGAGTVYDRIVVEACLDVFEDGTFSFD